MSIHIITFRSPSYRSMCDLRNRVLRKPLGLQLTENDIQKDEEDILIGYYKEDDKVIACCILSKIDETIVKLRQMAVDPAFQGKKIGEQMLQHAEALAREIGFQKITMNARKTADEFYKKYGYRVRSKEFIEVGIPHVKMEKRIV